MSVIKQCFILLCGWCCVSVCLGQAEKQHQLFTHADSLLGSPNAHRTWWDVQQYQITVQPNFEQKTITGSNTLHFKVVSLTNGSMQIDLQAPLVIDSVRWHKRILKNFKTSANTWLLLFPASINRQVANQSVTIYYHGKPLEAVHPPWDGGWIWKKDANGSPWMSAAVEEDGASAWYPCKDDLSDKPDKGATLTIIVADTLVAVGNGKCVKTTMHKGLVTYTWQVQNPINNYNIIPYIGKYVVFNDTLMGEKGILPLSYWVLDYNLVKAKRQFAQVKPMLHALEYWFGAYPFYEDGYKLVEAPHLGMEHQSAIAYGNNYANGYLGRDLSGTGWGMKWDFIIVHESGHEWFGNNITNKDLADQWIHEGFTHYSETLFTEYYYGKEAANAYCIGNRKNILNDIPIIGPYGVHKDGSSDRYYKGANMLQTIRHSMNNDVKFRQILRGLNTTFYHTTVTTQQIENYISQQAGFNYAKVFDQYLRTTQIPAFVYRIDRITSTITFHYNNCVAGFNLPLALPQGLVLSPTTTQQTVVLSAQQLAALTPKTLEEQYYLKVGM